MKKKVNGKTVEIGNIEVFEKATEGMVINRTTASTITDTVDLDLNLIDDYVDSYNSFYKSLPFPLYAIDSDVKYAVIGNYIKKTVKEHHKMWVNNGLYICIDEDKGIALNFVNSTWGIIGVDSIKEDNLDLESYKEECGFVDLVWALTKILKKQSTSTYYAEFMPDFIKACNNQPMVLKWELSNILDFGRIPDRYNFQPNKIIDLETTNEYMLDIFVAGLKESKEKQHVWSLFGDSELEPVMKPKYVKQYGFDVYEKLSTADENKIKPNADKIKKCEMFGALSLFNSLCAIKNVSEQNTFEEYTGFISDGNLAYMINNRVFVAKAYKYVEPKEVARGVELYAYDRGIVYLLKTKNLGKGIKKETIYGYSLKDGTLRLCKIQYVN